MFAYKGETLADYWDYTHRIFEFGPKGAEGEGPNMILDDGGDATLLMHLGKRAEQDASLLDKPTSEEETCLYAAIRAKLAVDATWYSRKSAQIIGVTEETTTGVHRLKEMSRSRARCCSARSTSTTASRRASSTTSTVAASRSSTRSSARPT